MSPVLDNVDKPITAKTSKNFSKAPLKLKLALSPRGMFSFLRILMFCPPQETESFSIKTKLMWFDVI